MDINLKVEEALRTIHEKAAVLRYLGDTAAQANHTRPDAELKPIRTSLYETDNDYDHRPLDYDCRPPTE